MTINIKIIYLGEDVEWIQIRGHHEGGVVGERACVGISILSRVLLHALDEHQDVKNCLKWGSFDIRPSKRRQAQDSARHTILGYRMIAETARRHVCIHVQRLGGGYGGSGGDSEAGLSSDDTTTY